jgi:predicted GH43/DUF377 family glycosyl hydrolase
MRVLREMKCAARNEANEMARDLHGRIEASAKQKTARRHKFQPLINAKEWKRMQRNNGVSVLNVTAVTVRRGLLGEQRLDLRNHQRLGVFISGLNDDFAPRTSFRAELTRRVGIQSH